KMIVRARTPKGLSWAGRLAVVGLTALLLPLAPTWGQKSDEKSKQDEGRRADSRQDEGRKEENRREERTRAKAERFEEHLKRVIEKLSKDFGPAGEEIRKALEKSIDEFHETLKKEDVNSDDVRKSMEKAYNSIRKAFESGGTVNRELRESMEESRRE